MSCFVLASFTLTLSILSFFRWHVIIGIVVPLITAGIFCACNTQVTFAYIDALFSESKLLSGGRPLLRSGRICRLFSLQYLHLDVQREEIEADLMHSFFLASFDVKQSVCTSALTLTGLSSILLGDMSFGKI